MCNITLYRKKLVEFFVLCYNMIMNYIGSKYSLIDFITASVNDTLKENNETRKPSDMIFADLFAGTAVVSSFFKKYGYSIIANDIQFYSYVIIKHLLENNGNLDETRCIRLIEELDNIKGTEGFIYKNYSYEGTCGQEFRRMYFSEYNAKKCDAIRIAIEKKRLSNEISENEYYFLLSSLINSIDKYANTASVYGAYLKKLKTSALKQMALLPLPIIHGRASYKTYNEDAASLIKKITGDILYLDPPYNERQYCTNYHLLETIAKYDSPTIKGKTGLRDYSEQKSAFCIKNKVETVFADLIKNANFKYIFLSYNNEGLMPLDKIENIMTHYGKYKVYTKKYKRFKADNARQTKAVYTTEYLHCLIKN